MNHGDVGCDVLHFVGLQVADEMPLNIGGQGSLLLAQFLFLAFSEDALSGFVCSLNRFVRVKFGYSNQADLGRKLCPYFF